MANEILKPQHRAIKTNMASCLEAITYVPGSAPDLDDPAFRPCRAGIFGGAVWGRVETI